MAKYNNTKYKGYDSIREYRRAQELKLLEKKGIISDLQEQCKYELIPAQYEYYEVKGVRKMLQKSYWKSPCPTMPTSFIIVMAN